MNFRGEEGFVFTWGSRSVSSEEREILAAEMGGEEEIHQVQPGLVKFSAVHSYTVIDRVAGWLGWLAGGGGC